MVTQMKNMLVVLLTAALILMSACSTQDKGDLSVDLDAAAEELLGSGVFEETLTQADEEIAKKLYGIENAVSFRLYAGSGATASELALLEFGSEEDAKAALALAQERVASQKESFASYLPGEVKKLEDAVVEQHGRYVVVCISAGDSGQILSKYFTAGD